MTYTVYASGNLPVITKSVVTDYHSSSGYSGWRMRFARKPLRAELTLCGEFFACTEATVKINEAILTNDAVDLGFPKHLRW